MPSNGMFVQDDLTSRLQEDAVEPSVGMLSQDGHGWMDNSLTSSLKPTFGASKMASTSVLASEG